MKIILEYDDEKVIVTKESKMRALASPIKKCVFLGIETPDYFAHVAELKFTGCEVVTDDEDRFQKLRGFADEIVYRWNESENKR